MALCQPVLGFSTQYSEQPLSCAYQPRLEIRHDFFSFSRQWFLSHWRMGRWVVFLVLLQNHLFLMLDMFDILCIILLLLSFMLFLSKLLQEKTDIKRDHRINMVLFGKSLPLILEELGINYIFSNLNALFIDVICPREVRSFIRRANSYLPVLCHMLGKAIPCRLTSDSSSGKGLFLYHNLTK